MTRSRARYRAARPTRCVLDHLTSWALGLAMVACTTDGQPEPVPAQTPPAPVQSIVLVTLDTTRADHLEPYGARDVATPTMKRLSESGVTFDAAYAVAPLTLVTHSSMLTGRTPAHHGVHDNGLYRLAEDTPSLAPHLSDHGWNTAAFVSAAVLARRYGLARGFDVYDDDLSSSRQRLPRMVADRPAEVTVTAAREWLDTQTDDTPYFLWVHLYDPHASYAPPEPYRSQHAGRPYDGEIAYMDAQVGRLLDHPRIDEDTLIAVMADHGESLGEHGEQTHGILAYDATLRVPWFLSGPGVPAGLRVSQPVSQVDLVPTLTALAGLPALPDADGRSLQPLLARRAHAPVPLYAESYLPANAYGWAPLHVARRGRWKLIDGPDPELYDTHLDPRELTNLITTRPDIHDALRQDLATLTADATASSTAQTDPQISDALIALGYISEAAPPRQGTAPDPKAVIHTHVDIERARQLGRDRLYDLAEQKLRDVLQVDGDNLAVWLELATMQEQRGDLQAAVTSLGEALSRAPSHISATLQLARLETRQGRPQRGLSLVESLRAHHPDDLSVESEYAALLSHTGRRADAVAAAEELLTRFERHPWALMVHARIVSLPNRDLTTATVHLEEALTKDPFSASGWHLLGEVHQLAGRPQEAVRAYERALQHRPDGAETHAALGLLHAHMGRDEAEPHLREALRLSNRPRVDLQVALGAWLAERGKLDAAEDAYQAVLTTEPDHPGARNNLAIAWYRTGRTEDARRALLELVAQFPDFPDPLGNLAAIAVDQGDWPTAAKYAREAVALAPGAVSAWNNLGVALDAQGDAHAALQAFDTALAAAPDYLPAKHNRAMALVSLDRHSEAASGFRDVLSRRPSHPDAHLELGRLLAGPMAQPDLAREHLLAFLRHGKGHPERQDAERILASLP